LCSDILLGDFDGMLNISFTAWNISIIIIGYFISIVVSHFIVAPIVRRLWKRYISETISQQPILPALVGMLERFLYTSAFLLEEKSFISVWLAIKLAGQWTPSKTDTDRPLYHIFLIGNGLSLSLSILAALFIKGFIRP